MRDFISITSNGSISSSINSVSLDQVVQLRTRRAAIYLRYCFVNNASAS